MLFGAALPPAATIDWSQILNVPLVFPPELHAASHESGGGDPLDLGLLAGMLVNGQVPAGVVVQHNAALDHGVLTGLGDDDHAQYLLLAGRGGGQSAFGSPVNGEDLTLAGNPGANPGFVNINSPIIFGSYSGNPLAAYALSYTETESFPGGFVGGGLNFSGTIDFANNVFIYESFRGSPTITSGIIPGFAAYTIMQALPVLRGGAAFFRPLNSLLINGGPTLENFGAGISLTTAQSIGLAFSSQTRASAGLATMNVTNITAVSCQPTFSTAALSVVDLGTIRGLHQRNPIVALFQPQSGTETMAANIAVDVDHIAFGGNVTKAAVRSGQFAASNAYFLLQTGNAQSILRGPLIFPVDTIGIRFGAAVGGDMNMGWASGNSFFLNMLANAGQWHFSNPSDNRLLLQGDVQGTELNMNFNRFSLGAQATQVGNQVGVFRMPARATTADGSWTDLLLAQGGNLTIDHTMSAVIAWTINPVVLTAGAGSITGYVAGLQVSQTNAGLGGAEKHAIRVIGRTTQLGVLAFEPFSPPVLTADVNDYAPAVSAALREVWRLATDDLGVRNITGIAPEQGSDTQILINVGSVDNIILQHQNVGSAAGNRFISPTGADLVLGPEESAFIWHDSVTDRWRILEHTGA